MARNQLPKSHFLSVPITRFEEFHYYHSSKIMLFGADRKYKNC